MPTFHRQYQDYVIKEIEKGRTPLPYDLVMKFPEDVKERLVSEEIPHGMDDDLKWREMADDPIGKILIKMYEVSKSKRADYTGDRGIFANFIESGDQVGISAGLGIEYMIATKQSRLKGLLRPGVKPNNESVEDTLLDRAVYSVLGLAAYLEGEYNL